MKKVIPYHILIFLNYYLYKFKNIYLNCIFFFEVNFGRDDNFIFILKVLKIKLIRIQRNWELINYIGVEIQRKQLEELLSLLNVTIEKYKEKDLKEYKRFSKIFFEKLNRYHIDLWY